MNYTIYSNQPLEGINIILPNKGINYTELGIFISGLLLSLGGCFSLIMGNLRRSNCKEVKIGCFSCSRQNMDIQEV